jgi:HEAT repeat protein
VIDRREVVAPLAELLRSGASDPITDRALEALRGLADPSSIEVLGEFTRHRRAGARRRAYLALAAIEDRRIPALLEQGLRDSERSIRASCATALGQIGARGSLDVLFHAFERGVVEAAAAIGKLGNEGSVQRYTNHLGQQPLSVMLSGYDEYLRRADIAEGTKIEIVNRLGEVSGRAVREFLSLYQTTFTPRDRSRLRQVVQDVIRRIPIEGDGRRTTAATSPEAGTNGGGQ